MLFLLSLFNARQPMRHFVLLDTQERCCALRHSREQPNSGNWVEVGETCISWLGHPLPTGARITPVVKHAQSARPLAA